MFAARERPTGLLGPLARVAAGTTYLVFLGYCVHVAFRTSLLAVAAAIAAGAVVIAATFCVLGWRLSQQPDKARRFGISTLMLATLQLSVYLAGLRWFIGAVDDSALGDSVNRTVIVVWAILALVWIAVTACVMLAWTEGVVWLFVWVRDRHSRPLAQSPP
ncbi:MAG: hypothetical protein QF805_29905 [Pirellulaceae bacterium]|nr:hypothetical protein [Pirellulaceae bacterium]